MKNKNPNKSILVKVEQKHIIMGNASDEHCCPIALALIDQGYLNPNVRGYIRWTDESLGKRLTAKFTKKAAKFVQRFDRGFGVKPTTFKFIPIPNENNSY